MRKVRYVYGITAALLLGGSRRTSLIVARSARRPRRTSPARSTPAPPRAGAPMSFADLAERLQPAVVNISTRQSVQIQPAPRCRRASRNSSAASAAKSRPGQAAGRRRHRHPARRLARLRLHHLGRRLYRHQQPRRRAGAHQCGGRVRSPSPCPTAPNMRPRWSAATRRPTSPCSRSSRAAACPSSASAIRTQVRVGDWVVAIGNPFGARRHRHRRHRLGAPPQHRRRHSTTATSRPTPRSIRAIRAARCSTSTAMSSASTPRSISPTGGNVGIGFAIPAEQARPIVDALRRGERVRRGYIGVSLQVDRRRQSPPRSASSATAAS